MKTTFRTVFHELEDELMDIDLNTDKTADIDVEKIKGEVLMRIKENGTNNSNKKFSKRITFILVAAVILITGTIGAFATGSVQQIFGRLFRNGSKPDAMGLYSSKNVEVSTNDDNLNVNVLGVTGDGERLYSAIEITRKDGGAVIDEDYHTFSAYGNFNHFQTEYTNKDGNKMSVADTCTYQLDDNNRTLTIYLSSLSLSEKMEKGSVTGTLHSLDVFKIEQVLASMDLPEISHDTNPDDVKINFSDAELAEKRKQFGVTEEECISIDHDGKREYCKASQKNFAIDFTVSYDFDYSDEYFIKKELNSDSAKNILKADVQNIPGFLNE